MNKVRAHVLVSGKVQGVFFRQKTQQQAQIFGITGWVRNLPDGRVEAVFEGEEEAVKALVDYCRQGPSIAIVENVNVTYGKITTANLALSKRGKRSYAFFFGTLKMRIFPSANVLAAHAAHCRRNLGKVFRAQKLLGLNNYVIAFLLKA